MGPPSIHSTEVVGMVPGLPKNLREFDLIIQDFQNSGLPIIAERSSMGKATFAF